jgi:hypothetical protein
MKGLKKIPILLLISLLFLCIKCEDYLEPEGIESSVYGTVYDSVNDMPVVDQKLLIVESNVNGFYNLREFIQILDSTQTDINGFYEMNFTTSGKGDTYSVQPERQENNWTYYQDAIQIENLNSEPKVDFNFLHLYAAVLNIRLESDVENLPVGVTHRYHGFSYIFINETDKAIQERIFIDKNQPQFIKIFRNISLNKSENFIYVIPATNTTEGTEYNINVRNSDFVN